MTFAVGADLFASAPEIFTSSGDSSLATDNTSYTRETGEPDPIGATDHSAWWKYTPTSSGTVTFDTIATVNTGHGTDTVMAVYTGSSLTTLTMQASDDESGGNSTSKISNLAVTAGTTYYIQVGAYLAGTQMQYVLTCSALAVAGLHGGLDTEIALPAAALNVAVPLSASVDAEVATAGRLQRDIGDMTASLEQDIQLAAALDRALSLSASLDLAINLHGVLPLFVDLPIPATATATAPAPTLYTRLDLPPALAHTQAVAPTSHVLGALITSPQPNAQVPATPKFAVQAYVETGSATVQVSVTDHTNATVFTVQQQAAFTYVNSAAPVILTAPAALTAGTYQAAATVFDGGVWSSPATRSFTVEPALDGHTTVTLSVTVDPAAAAQVRLWGLRPASAYPNDPVTLIGTGISPTATGVLGGVTAATLSRQRVAATAQAGTDARRIDLHAGVIDPEHDELVVTVPAAVAPPGVGVYVQE